MDEIFSEPYTIKMIHRIKKSSRSDRENWIKEAHYNVFNLKSEQVYIDLLSDSGTGAMSDQQWSEMMTGDESYSGSTSFEKLKKVIQNIFGFKYILPVHQGRAAENVLFSCLVKDGHIIPGNTCFDTTKGHIEYRKATVIDCTIDEAFDLSNITHPFKGNLDIEKLQNIFNKQPKRKIPFVVITMTCNSGGGHPISMTNIEEVSALCKQYEVPLCVDACRFAINAYFIKTREAAYSNWALIDIVRKMFSFVDMATMSGKKDGYVNMGGFIGVNNNDLYQQAQVYTIMFEGFITYGGMTGRDMSAFAQGLIEATDFETIESSVKQVEYLGKKLEEYNIPILKPTGGHAVYIDAGLILSHIPREKFPAQTLVVELYIQAGIRSVEIGTLLADRDPKTKENRFPKRDMIRLAIPRRTYTCNHLDVVGLAMKNVMARRQEITSGIKIKWEAPIMRHFTVKLERDRFSTEG